ncbi:MAG TPA: glycosyltransferase family 4 protein [Vicinamibacteria bacterium]|nr:glycosyltransferase family 4 protein [Vicinamibacteria bacterium]
MRLAFVSPLPPAGTGIADYSAEVLALLAPCHQIDVFHDQEVVEPSRLPEGCGVFRARELLSRHRDRAYDLVVYQMGNGPEHGFLYDLLAPLPGLLVLHDLVLHHSRAKRFLDSPEVRAYAADPASAAKRDGAQVSLAAYAEEVAYSYPAAADRLAEAQLGTLGDLLPYAYPLFRIPVEVSRLTAVHNSFMAAAIDEEVPGAPVTRLAMAVQALPVPPGAAGRLRERYRLAPDDFVVGSFGLLTREKRLATLARAVARLASALPRLRLLLVGPVPDRGALDALLERVGLSGRSVVTGRVPFEELGAHMEAVDLAVHLRYPTARETSAALLRLLAQGRPVVMSDLGNFAEVPEAAVVRADVADEEGEVTRALLRLAENPAARARLGSAAREFVRREHSPARCLETHQGAIERARQLPDPPRRNWPKHWG